MTACILKTLWDIKKISLHCSESKNNTIINDIRCVLHNTLDKCENIYFEYMLNPHLHIIWEQENTLLKHILLFIYINVATLPTTITQSVEKTVH